MSKAAMSVKPTPATATMQSFLEITSLNELCRVAAVVTIQPSIKPVEPGAKTFDKITASYLYFGEDGKVTVYNQIGFTYNAMTSIVMPERNEVGRYGDMGVNRPSVKARNPLETDEAKFMDLLDMIHKVAFDAKKYNSGVPFAADPDALTLIPILRAGKGDDFYEVMVVLNDYSVVHIDEREKLETYMEARTSIVCVNKVNYYASKYGANTRKLPPVPGKSQASSELRFSDLALNIPYGLVPLRKKNQDATPKQLDPHAWGFCIIVMEEDNLAAGRLVRTGDDYLKSPEFSMGQKAESNAFNGQVTALFDTVTYVDNLQSIRVRYLCTVRKLPGLPKGRRDLSFLSDGIASAPMMIKAKQLDDDKEQPEAAAAVAKAQPARVIVDDTM